MPRRYIKRYLPNHDKIRNYQHLRFLGPLLHDPNLLHLNRRSVSGAFAVGLFMAWVPIPFQMVLAAITAIFIRVNLPISVALVWISNPLTMPPLYYFAYKIGTWVLDENPQPIHFELSTTWLTQSLSAIWQPFLLGCLIAGIVSALFGVLTIRGLWRIHVIQNWRDRKTRRKRHKNR
ncbi:MAG: DUF2062 domain-containing protein [Gammaproteobacteria bacterium]|nr:DUF2062 domain-containing protein [Gammaproteobacteria bacterium]